MTKKSLTNNKSTKSISNKKKSKSKKKDNFKQSNTKVRNILLSICAIIVVVGIITVTQRRQDKVNQDVIFELSDEEKAAGFKTGSAEIEIDGQKKQISAKYIIDGEEIKVSDKVFESKKEGESVFLVINGGKLTIGEKTTVNKLGKKASTANESDYYNDAIVVIGKGSKLVVSDAKISTAATSANAITVLDNATADIKNATISTTNNDSNGVYVNNYGAVAVSSAKITSAGKNSATLIAGSKKGNIAVKNATVQTTGDNSPVILSSGDISIQSAEIITSSSNAVIIKNNGVASISKSKINTAAKNEENVASSAIMLYGTGDYLASSSTFNIEESTITIPKTSSVYNTAPIIFASNTKSTININKTTLLYGSNAFMKVAETNLWGDKDNNGSEITVNASHSTIKGKVTADKNSQVTMNLDSTGYSGTTAGNITINK